jgi:hypothetical protein
MMRGAEIEARLMLSDYEAMLVDADAATWPDAETCAAPAEARASGLDMPAPRASTHERKEIIE